MSNMFDTKTTKAHKELWGDMLNISWDDLSTELGITRDIAWDNSWDQFLSDSITTTIPGETQADISQQDLNLQFLEFLEFPEFPDLPNLSNEQINALSNETGITYNTTRPCDNPLSSSPQAVFNESNKRIPKHCIEIQDNQRQRKRLCQRENITLGPNNGKHHSQEISTAGLGDQGQETTTANTSPSTKRKFDARPGDQEQETTTANTPPSKRVKLSPRPRDQGQETTTANTPPLTKRKFDARPRDQEQETTTANTPPSKRIKLSPRPRDQKHPKRGAGSIKQATDGNKKIPEGIISPDGVSITSYIAEGGFGLGIGDDDKTYCWGLFKSKTKPLGSPSNVYIKPRHVYNVIGVKQLATAPNLIFAATKKGYVYMWSPWKSTSRSSTRARDHIPTLVAGPGVDKSNSDNNFKVQNIFVRDKFCFIISKNNKILKCALDKSNVGNWIPVEGFKLDDIFELASAGEYPAGSKEVVYKPRDLDNIKY